MTSEELSKIIDQSIKSVNLDKLKKEKCGAGKDSVFAVMKLISKDYLGAAESTVSAVQKYLDYKESEFFRKYYRYLYELANTTPEQRHQFAKEVQEIAEDSSGNVIMGMVDRMDNIHKEEFLAKLTIARINGWITIEEFFRLSSLLERIPYVDLKMLPYYKEPYYDESGDTELLYATGALNQNTINVHGRNKYVLSVLGVKLLCFGMGIYLEMEHETGTNVELNYASPEVCESIVDELT